MRVLPSLFVQVEWAAEYVKSRAAMGNGGSTAPDASAIIYAGGAAARRPSRRAGDADGRQRTPNTRLSGRDVPTYPRD